jgi:hypothetical protein
VCISGRWIIALMMEAANASETPVNVYQTTLRNIVEDRQAKCWWDICGCTQTAGLRSCRQSASCSVSKLRLVNWGAEWLIYGLLNDVVSSSDIRPSQCWTTGWHFRFSERRRRWTCFSDSLRHVDLQVYSNVLKNRLPYGVTTQNTNIDIRYGIISEKWIKKDL